MTDRFGKEIKTGDIVVIRNGYAKTSNGRFVVIHSPGDSSWLGNDYCLCRLGKGNEVSRSKYKIKFWPIVSFVNSFDQRLEANIWNRENATIEITGHMNEIPEV